MLHAGLLSFRVFEMHRGSRSGRRNRKILKDQLEKIKWFYGLKTTEELEKEIKSVQDKILNCTRLQAIRILMRRFQTFRSDTPIEAHIEARNHDRISKYL